MELNKILDLAIMADETAKYPDIKSGYSINGKTYDNYLDNASWDSFKKRMESDNPAAYRRYGNGGGKELDEHKTGVNVYPPKMASFGSSSRMIYNLTKDVYEFLFEEKLPTYVGGTANLDGFKDYPERCVFVEAKCREPYSNKTSTVDRVYQALYEYISDSPKTDVTCKISDLTDKQKNEKKMKVTFMSGETELQRFDMKQMICHLLGVACEFLNDNSDIKKIDFIYLLFNPKLININEGKEKIHNIYDKTCEECDSIDFKALFEAVVDYLLTIKEWKNVDKADEIVANFSFHLVDQKTYKNYIN